MSRASRPEQREREGDDGGASGPLSARLEDVKDVKKLLTGPQATDVIAVVVLATFLEGLSPRVRLISFEGTLLAGQVVLRHLTGVRCVMSADIGGRDRLFLGTSLAVITGTSAYVGWLAALPPDKNRAVMTSTTLSERTNSAFSGGLQFTPHATPRGVGPGGPGAGSSVVHRQPPEGPRQAGARGSLRWCHGASTCRCVR